MLGIIRFILIVAGGLFGSSFLFGNVSVHAHDAHHVRITSNAPFAWKIGQKLQPIRATITSKMLPFSYHGLSVFVDKNQQEPRAKIRGKHMIISAHVQDFSEFLKLFVHELGHFVDIYVLNKTFFKQDYSEIFYAISWKNANVQHPGSSLSDFISGYAATNQYEDFAETFVWYIFHNIDFMDRALRNDVLRQKYLFFAQYVFPGWQFQGTDFSSAPTQGAYLWDTTKTPILLKNYLSFLK